MLDSTVSLQEVLDSFEASKSEANLSVDMFLLVVGQTPDIYTTFVTSSWNRGTMES